MNLSKRKNKIGLFFVMLMVCLFLVGGIAFAVPNPPGPKGGPGAGKHWRRPRVNPPGPAGGPGTSWWIPKRSYKDWKRDELRERLDDLKDYRTELIEKGAKPERVEALTEQIEKIEDILD